MKKIVFFAVALLGGTAFAAEPAVVKKEGGIGFRFDDNRTVKMWQEMADVFNKYNFPLKNQPFPTISRRKTTFRLEKILHPVIFPVIMD